MAEKIFTRWSDILKCEKSFDELSNPLMWSRNGPVSEDRVPKSVEEIVRLAKQYMDANSRTIPGKAKPSYQKQNKEHKTDPKAVKKAQGQQEDKCFLCQRTEHIAKECKLVKPPSHSRNQQEV